MSSESAKRSPQSRRRWYQFSLASLFALLTLAAIAAAWYASQTRRLDTLRVDIGTSVTTVDSLTASDLPFLLASRVKRFSTVGLAPSAATVVVRVDDEATYGQFRHVIEDCWHAGLRLFVLETNGERQVFDVSTYSTDWDRRVIDDALILIVLLGDSQGSLARIEIGGRSISMQGQQGFTNFRSTVSDMLGQVDGINMRANDDLPFKHIAAAIDALKVALKDGKREVLMRAKLVLVTVVAPPRNDVITPLLEVH